MGHITKRDGRWIASVQDEAGAVHRKSFAAERRAKAWVSRFEAARARVASPEEAEGTIFDTTLGDILKRYGREVTPQKKGASSESYKIEALRRTDLAAILLNDLTSKAIADYRNHRLTFVAPSTVRIELSLIRRVIEVARREWGFEIGRNPAALVSNPHVANARDRRLQAGELGRLEEQLERHPMALAVVRFAIHTAMRQGEILSLTWRHVSIPKRLAHLPLTKNGRARTVPLTDGAMSVLDGLKVTDELVFPIDKHALRWAWTQACSNARVDDLTFHDLRHEGVSRLFEMGLNPAEVAMISGHQTVSMLFRYVHLRPMELARKLKGLKSR